MAHEQVRELWNSSALLSIITATAHNRASKTGINYESAFLSRTAKLAAMKGERVPIVEVIEREFLAYEAIRG